MMHGAGCVVGGRRGFLLESARVVLVENKQYSVCVNCCSTKGDLLQLLKHVSFPTFSRALQHLHASSGLFSTGVCG